MTSPETAIKRDIGPNLKKKVDEGNGGDIEWHSNPISVKK